MAQNKKRAGANGAQTIEGASQDKATLFETWAERNGVEFRKCELCKTPFRPLENWQDLCGDCEAWVERNGGAP